MPGYIQAALHKYNHIPAKRPQHAPYPCRTPDYGAKQQFAPPEDTSKPLNRGGVKQIQKITGTLLYYALAVDSTILIALGSIAA